MSRFFSRHIGRCALLISSKKRQRRLGGIIPQAHEGLQASYYSSNSSPRRVAAIALPLVWCLSGAGAAALAEDLEISLDGNGAPAIVTIVGPKSLLDRAAEVAKLRDDKCVIHQIFIGQGFGIDWGDDGHYGTQAEPPILGPDR